MWTITSKMSDPSILMYPSGKVSIDGVEYSARFKSGFADSGDEVVVVGLDAFGLIVGKPESPPEQE